MKFGFVMPSGDARKAAELGEILEQAGWDALFVWEPVWGFDAWICLTAAAMRTTRLRLGTLITPLARMRPWKLASETVTLDHLSGGRVILGVGLGATDTGWAEFGEPTDRKLRAELLDEGLEILTGLWKGQPFAHAGKHYHVRPMNFMPPPPPVQQPRIPIWVVGAWPREKSMRRALKYDGLLPNVLDEKGEHRTLSVEDVRQMRQYADAHLQGERPYEIVVEGATPADDRQAAAEQALAWEQAGATWWIEALWSAESDDQVLHRARAGPPRV